GKVIPFIPAAALPPPGGPVYTLPPVSQPGDDGIALPYDAVCTGFTTKSAWKAAGQPRCPTMVESPPFQVQPQPYDPGSVIQPQPGATVPVIRPQPGGTVDGGISTIGGTTPPSDPNLIFGFPKQQVMIGVAL